MADPVETVETPAPEKVVSDAPVGDAPVENMAPPPEVPSYEPNYKFKVKDKELEFDEPLRPLIKEKAVEDKIRDLYTRGYGLEEIQTQRNDLEQKFGQISTEFQKAWQHIEKGDMDQAFARLGIPEEKVLKWVSEKLRVEGLPQTERYLYDQKRQSDLARQSAEEQQNALRMQVESSMVQTRNLELNMVLARDDVKSLSDAYDARLAKPGAFREEVKNYGALVWHNQRRDISAEEAATAVVSRLKPFLVAQGGAASPTSPNNTVVMEKTATPTIPALGRAGTPSKAKVMSIADLRAKAKELANQNGG